MTLEEGSIPGPRRGAAAGESSLPSDQQTGADEDTILTGRRAAEVDLDETVVTPRRSGALPMVTAEDEDVDSTVLSPRRASEAIDAPRTALPGGDAATMAEDAGGFEADETIATPRRGRPVEPVDAAADGGAHDVDDTVLSGRRAAPAMDAHTAAGDEDADDTVVAPRRPRRPGDVEVDDDLDATVASSRRSSPLVDADDDPDLTLPSSRQSDLYDTAVGVRHHIPYADLGPARDRVGDSTIISEGPPGLPVPASSGIGAVEDGANLDATDVVPRLRRSSVPGDADARALRAASQPDTRILKEPYRPRPVTQEPVFRTQPAPQPLQPQADTVKAAHQQRAAGRRRFVTVLVVAGLIVVGAIAGLVAIIVGLF